MVRLLLLLLLLVVVVLLLLLLLLLLWRRQRGWRCAVVGERELRERRPLIREDKLRQRELVALSLDPHDLRRRCRRRRCIGRHGKKRS